MFAGDTFFSREKKRRNKMKNTVSRLFPPKMFPIKKVNENQKKSIQFEQYVPKPFFIEQFSYEDFGRILGGFWQDFVRIL